MRRTTRCSSDASRRAGQPGRPHVMRMDFPSGATFRPGVQFYCAGFDRFALKFPDSWLASVGIRRRHPPLGARIAGSCCCWRGLSYRLHLVTRQGRRLIKDMIPTPKDARDMAAQRLLLDRRTKGKPKFGRFGYAEKMEYWAVLWGTIIMGATGLMIWFKLGAPTGCRVGRLMSPRPFIIRSHSGLPAIVVCILPRHF